MVFQVIGVLVLGVSQFMWGNELLGIGLCSQSDFLVNIVDMYHLLIQMFLTFFPTSFSKNIFMVLAQGC